MIRFIISLSVLFFCISPLRAQPQLDVWANTNEIMLARFSNSQTGYSPATNVKLASQDQYAKRGLSRPKFIGSADFVSSSYNSAVSILHSDKAIDSTNFALLIELGTKQQTQWVHYDINISDNITRVRLINIDSEKAAFPKQETIAIESAAHQKSIKPSNIQRPAEPQTIAPITRTMSDNSDIEPNFVKQLVDMTRQINQLKSEIQRKSGSNEQTPSSNKSSASPVEATTSLRENLTIEKPSASVKKQPEASFILSAEQGIDSTLAYLTTHTELALARMLVLGLIILVAGVSLVLLYFAISRRAEQSQHKSDLQERQTAYPQHPAAYASAPLSNPADGNRIAAELQNQIEQLANQIKELKQQPIHQSHNVGGTVSQDTAPPATNDITNPMGEGSSFAGTRQRIPQTATPTPNEGDRTPKTNTDSSYQEPPSEEYQLAIVYKNMGDINMAKTLFQELEKNGSPDDKKRAADALKKINENL